MKKHGGCSIITHKLNTHMCETHQEHFPHILHRTINEEHSTGHISTHMTHKNTHTLYLVQRIREIGRSDHNHTIVLVKAIHLY